MTGTATSAAAANLLRQALELHRDNQRAAGWLHRHLARFEEPLRLAVLGHRGAGKSTLVDALANRHSPQELAILDTPTIDEHAVAQSVRAGCADADAVLYLTPSPYRDSGAALRAGHEHPIAASTPVSSLAVVSRADELGSGRVDALIAARQVARQYRDEPEVRDLSQDAVAVSGLVAATAATLTENEFAALSTLANSSRAELEQHLLSVDRFTRADSPLTLAKQTRESLLERLGLFGLRLATTLIRRGANSPTSLAAQLAQRSGMAELDAAIRRYFVDHANTLKARTALIALDVVLRREQHPGGSRLLAEVDRILAGAHEYRELRLISELGSGRATLPDELATEAARLIGAEGSHPVLRLALDSNYPPTDPHYQQALFGALWRWREHAENPAFSAAQREISATVVRSCEAMATDALAE